MTPTIFDHHEYSGKRRFLVLLHVLASKCVPQFIITALGSYGDVYPMVGLGGALRDRGHRVKLVTNPYFEQVVTGAGLEFVSIGTREEYVALTEHPHLWHPLLGPRLIMRSVCAGLLRPLYELVTRHYVPGETVLCAHALDFASRVAAEKLGAPLAAINFAPGIIWSVYDSPRIKGALSGPRVPQWLKRLQYWTADRLFVLSLVSTQLNGLRRELGLAPVRRVYGEFMYDCDLVLCLFPDWFGPPQPDWPANTRLVGFPHWDANGEVELADDVREFLAAGDPPIAFSPGSANKEAHAFFAAAVEACERLGRRGILLTKYDHQLPRDMPAAVRHFGFVPLSKLLPHTAALVHHGGIGSCAQGLAAGVPHLVQPMSYDQFDNSRRLVRLGVAEELSVRRFRGTRIAAALERLLSSATVQAKCRDLASRCDGPAAFAAACDELEQLSVASHQSSVSSN